MNPRLAGLFKIQRKLFSESGQCNLLRPSRIFDLVHRVPKSEEMSDFVFTPSVCVRASVRVHEQYYYMYLKIRETPLPKLRMRTLCQSTILSGNGAMGEEGLDQHERSSSRRRRWISVSLSISRMTRLLVQSLTSIGWGSRRRTSYRLPSDRPTDGQWNERRIEQS